LVPTAKTKKEAATPSKEVKYHKAPADFRELVHTLIGNAPGLKSHGDDVPYEFSGSTEDGREYSVRIFVDQAPQKQVTTL